MAAKRALVRLGKKADALFEMLSFRRHRELATSLQGLKASKLSELNERTIINMKKSERSLILNGQE